MPKNSKVNGMQQVVWSEMHSKVRTSGLLKALVIKRGSEGKVLAHTLSFFFYRSAIFCYTSLI